jgi:hypothetical protein
MVWKLIGKFMTRKKVKTFIAVVAVICLAAIAIVMFHIHRGHQPAVLKDLLPSVRSGHHEEQLANGTFLRSKSGPTSRIIFYNNTRQALQVFWLDFDGHRQKYGDLPPFSRFQQGTFATHVWLLVDGDDKLVALFVAAPGNCVANITP